MPNITLPHRAATDLSPGSVTSAADVAENFYAPNTTPDSIEVVNGQLDNANRAAGWDVDRVHIQPRAVSHGKSVGSTLNLDFFGKTAGGVFGEWASGNDLSDLYLPIPGANITFYLPYSPSVLLVTWRIFVGPNGNDTRSKLRLYRNGAQVTNQTRQVWGAAPTGTREGLPWDRTWCGFHYESAPAIGWYTFGLRVAGDNNNLRARCRGIDCTYFW